MFKNPIKEAVNEAVNSVSSKVVKDFNDLLSKGKELESLQNEIRNTKDELASVRKQKNLEMQEFEHLVRLKEERQKLALETERITMERNFQTKELELQREYHKKLEGKLDEYSKDLKETYAMITEKLPNISVKMKGDV